MAAKRSSPLARGDGKAGVEVITQGGGTLEADQLGDAIDGMTAHLQQLLTAPEPFRQQPTHREAGSLMKAAGKGAPAHQGMGCQRVLGVGFGQMGAQVIVSLVHPDIVGGGGHRLLDKLGLSPFPMRRDRQPCATLLAMAEPWYWRTR